MGVNIRGVSSHNRERPSHREIIESKYPQMKAYYAYVSDPENKITRDKHSDWHREITPMELMQADEFLTQGLPFPPSKEVFGFTAKELPFRHNFDRAKTALNQVIAAKLLSAATGDESKMDQFKRFISEDGIQRGGAINQPTIYVKHIPDPAITAEPLIKNEISRSL